MNNHEAKFILHGYRPHGRDAGDPQFAEALRQAQEDPHLASWLAQEQEVDAAIARKVQTCPLPEGLKEAILAGRKIVAATAWWRRREVLAVAASLVFVAVLAAFWLKPGGASTVEILRQDLTQMLSTGSYSLQAHAEDIAQLKESIRAHGGHADFVLPAGLKDARGYGCQVLDWRGKSVTMICLRTSEAGIVHLFVIRASDLPGAPRPGAPRFARRGEWASAAWTLEDKTYLLVGLTDRQTLQKIL